MTEADAQREADRITLAKYTPAGVIVKVHFEIVQFRGSTSCYLEPMPGEASFHVLKMARVGHRRSRKRSLHPALHAARREGVEPRADRRRASDHHHQAQHSFPCLERFIVDAIDQMRTQQTEVPDRDGRRFSLHALPYRTMDNKITEPSWSSSTSML